MICQGCGYSLHGLRDNRCPECGQAFDPAAEQLEQDRRLRSSRRLAKVAAGCALWQLGAVLLMYSTWLVARISLGHWPVASVDDPKYIGPLTSAFRDVTALALIGSVPILGFGLLTAMISAAEFPAPPGRRAKRAVALIGGVLIVGLACTLFLRWDPYGVVRWYWD